MASKMNSNKTKLYFFILFAFGIFIYIFFPFTEHEPSISDLANVNTNMDAQTKEKNAPNAVEVVETNVEIQKGEIETVEKSSLKNRSIWNRLPPGTQMGELQVASIRKVMKSDDNLLVWGLGNDSPYWHDATSGKVVFIEPAGVWFDKITKTYPYLEAYKVKYTTEVVKSYNRYINSPELWSELDIRSQLPPVVLQTHWHVIIVDAPPGYGGQPGRYQSIYTSSLLAKNGSHIFVDDYERKVERQFSMKMIGSPVEVIKRPPKGAIGANEQAHFIYNK